MKYTIHNICHESHDLDEDIIYFIFDIHFTEPEALVIKKYFYPFDRLLSYLHEKNLSFYQYIESVRQSIDAWGMAERQTIEAIGDEALQQLYDCLEEYLSSCDWIEKLFDREKQFRNQTHENQQKDHEKSVEVFKDLSECASSLRKSQNRYLRFCEKVEKKIRETAMEMYPEIVDIESEQLKKFKHLFVRDIQNMHSRIEKLLSEQKD